MGAGTLQRTQVIEVDILGRRLRDVVLLRRHGVMQVADGDAVRGATKGEAALGHSRVPREKNHANELIIIG